MLLKKYKLPIKSFPRENVKNIIRNDFLSIKKHPNNLSYNRFGVIISAKYNKRAVKRNQIKRFIYKNLESVYNNLTPTSDFLILINTKSENEAKLKQSIIESIKKL